jgi:photosystem II stability/assembly factor-like uncharacterized protein
LFLSTDAGASFTQIGAGLPYPTEIATSSLAFDPANVSVVYASGGPAGLFRSVDGALTFERLGGLAGEHLFGVGVANVALSGGDTGPAIIYASTSLGPVRSDDSGKTFATIHNGYRGTAVNDLAIDAAGRLLVATIYSAGVFRSSAQGMYQVISENLPHEPATNDFAVAAAADNPDLYLLGGGYDVFRTTDSGASWSRSMVTLSGPRSRMRIAFAPSDSRRAYMVRQGGGLFRSGDGGQSFDRLLTDTMDALAVDPTDPDVVYVGTFSSGRGLFKSTDGGRSLQQLAASGNFSAVAIDSKNPQVIYAGAWSGLIIRSLDGGQTFSPVTAGLLGDRVLGLAVDPSQPTRLFAWMHAGGLFRSDNRADVWMPVVTGETLRRSTAQLGLTPLLIQPGDPVHVYLGNGSVLQFVDQ